MMELAFMLVDVMVAALLVAVIVYCRNLNTNIKVLQDSRSEMAKLFAEFDQSIERASHSIEELKEAARKSDVVLKEKLDTANMIADDLSFMIERGNKMADQLESGLKGGRSALAKESSSSTPHLKPQPAFETGSASPKKDLDRAVPPSSRNTASIDSVLEQMASRSSAQAKTAEGKPAAKMRSKAEQELLDSLKTGGRQ